MVDQAMYRTNLMYGALNPKLSKVITIHGSADPWLPLGLNNDLSEDAVVIVVNGSLKFPIKLKNLHK